MGLELRNISFSYMNYQVLQNISFSCNKGEIVGLIGGNGAGKTTTIKNIVRYLQPSSGEILLEGKSIFSLGDTYPISYIPDAPVFFDELSVLEHLQFMKAVYPNNNTDISYLIERLKLKAYLDALPLALSKGTKQKLMIAIALLREYEILIADEPFTGLDPTQIAQLKKIFVEQKEAQKIVLLSTHLLDVVENICDRFVIIQSGNICANGSREEILRLNGIDPNNSSLEDAYIKLVKENE